MVEIYEMTRAEFVEAFLRNDPTFRVRSTTGEIVTPETKGWGWLVDARHEAVVKRALTDSKPVSSAVLADYPHLIRKRRV